MFQRIDAKHAGPDTLGILIPPGQRTLVVLRPRGVDWDLLPARWDGNHASAPVFCTFTRDEAARTARQLMEELESASDNPLGTFGNADGTCVQIWLQTKDFVWVACHRTPGSGYQPMIFSSPEIAVASAEKLAAVFWPSEGTIQTYYFNTQGFH